MGRIVKPFYYDIKRLPERVAFSFGKNLMVNFLSKSNFDRFAIWISAVLDGQAK